jgi:O-Antigen ligase
VAISLFKDTRAALPFWVMTIYLILLALTGGGARSDVQSLVILRPVSALVLGYALWSLTWDRVRPYRFLCFFLMAMVFFVALQLIPLPPSIWMSLPGREFIAEIDRAAQLGAVWRPVSMIPSQTWNALYSLVVPAAVFALMMRLTREQRFALIPVLILIGLFSGFIGLLQVIGSQDSPLYLYNITNNGSAVGLFANRNHQAVMLACLFPMLAVYASTGLQTIEQSRFRATLAIGAGVFLVPLLLVTGSRAGLIVGLFGLMAVAVLYRRPHFTRPAKRKVRRFNPNYLTAGAAVFGIAALAIIMSRAEALDRLLARDDTEELRFAIWPSIHEMAGKYFPVGSGFGTFVEVYQIDEPLQLLDQTYVNHAHNDWLELVFTGGAGAILLAAAAIGVWIRFTWALFKTESRKGRDVTVGKLGALIIFMLALASIGDYPLRVPSLMGVIVIAAVWMCGGCLTNQAADVASQKKGGAD